MKAPVIALAIALAHGADASAATAETYGPLPAGRPAGVQQAQLSQDQTMLIGAAVMAGIGVALALSSYDNPAAPPTNTAAAP